MTEGWANVTATTRVPALVLGGVQAALGAFRAFGAAGIPVYGLNGPEDYVARSRHFRRYPGWSGPTPSASREVLDTLLAAHQGPLVLCPCSDHWTAIVAGEPPRPNLFAAAPSPDVLALLQDKRQFASTLDRLGVPHPATRPLAEPSDLAGVSDRDLRAGFLKPTDSQRFSDRFGRKAFWAATRDDAIRILREATSADLEVLFQEYVPGGPDRHIFIDGYCRAGGDIAALFPRRRLRMFPADFGNSTMMVSIGLDEVAPAVASLRTLLAGIGYRGIFSAEFKQDARDDVYRIIEVNTRPWLFVDFATRCGVNVCQLAYLDALGQPVPDVPAYRVGARCIAPIGDLHALHVPQQMSGLGRWALDLARSSQPIWRLDDPMPGLVVTMREARHLGRYLTGKHPAVR